MREFQPVSGPWRFKERPSDIALEGLIKESEASKTLPTMNTVREAKELYLNPPKEEILALLDPKVTSIRSKQI